MGNVMKSSQSRLTPPRRPGPKGQGTDSGLAAALRLVGIEALGRLTCSLSHTVPSLVHDCAEPPYLPVGRTCRPASRMPRWFPTVGVISFRAPTATQEADMDCVCFYPPVGTTVVCPSLADPHSNIGNCP